MSGYLARRLLRGLFTIYLSVTITFLILRMMPGDPVDILLSPQMTPEVKAQLMKEYGLNRPVSVQYVYFLREVARGNLGLSYISRRPISDLIMDRLPWTLYLMVTTIVFTVLLGIPLGVLAAVRRGSLLDRAINAFTVVGNALFVPWLGILLLYFLGYKLPLFPIGGAVQIGAEGSDRVLSILHHLVLPATTLIIAALATYVLFMRTSMVEVLREEYIKTARAKGLREQLVIFKHALRNAMLPAVTVLGLQLGFLVGGAVLTETIFAYPGVGRMINEAVRAHDYPVLQGTFIVLAVTVVAANLLTDMAYGWLDPRITYH